MKDVDALMKDVDAQQMIAVGILALCVMLGFGGCNVLVSLSYKYDAEREVIKAHK